MAEEVAGTLIDTVKQPNYNLSVEDVLQIPEFRHLKPETLAKWRQIGKGPKYTLIGRKAFYSLALIHEWKREEANAREHKQKGRSMALPIQTQRGDIRSLHRLGGHQVKRERSQGHRV